MAKIHQRISNVKVLSLWQPWANLVVIRAKKNETRSWKTKYRGEIYIHASARFYLCHMELCQQNVHFRKFLPDPELLPTGAIMGKAELVDCIPVEEIKAKLSEQELAFGDYSPGRYAWILENATPVPTVRVRGQQGIWNYEIREELDPDYIGPDEESQHEPEPDLMAPNAAERSEMMYRTQRDLKW